MTTEELSKAWNETPASIADSVGNLREILLFLREENRRSERLLQELQNFLPKVEQRALEVEGKFNRLVAEITRFLAFIKELKK